MPSLRGRRAKRGGRGNPELVFEFPGLLRRYAPRNDDYRGLKNLKLKRDQYIPLANEGAGFS